MQAASTSRISTSRSGLSVPLRDGEYAVDGVDDVVAGDGVDRVEQHQGHALRLLQHCLVHTFACCLSVISRISASSGKYWNGSVVSTRSRAAPWLLPRRRNALYKSTASRVTSLEDTPLEGTSLLLGSLGAADRDEGYRDGGLDDAQQGTYVAGCIDGISSASTTAGCSRFTS